MNSTNFCYWLQGFCEIHGQTPTTQQWTIIKDHLNLVLGTPPIVKLNFKAKSTCSCGRTEAEQKDCLLCKIPIC